VTVAGAVALTHGQLSRESFDVIHYGGMAVYKIGVPLLNLAPLVALLIVV
jgi:hypothetical protein